MHDSESILSIERIPDRFVVVGGGPVGVRVRIDLPRPRRRGHADRSRRPPPAVSPTRRSRSSSPGSSSGAAWRSDSGSRSRASSGETRRSRWPSRPARSSARTRCCSPRVGRARRRGSASRTRASRSTNAAGSSSTTPTGPRPRAVYAAGDVIGPPALASVSMEQGRVAVCHAFDIPFKDTVDPTPAVRRLRDPRGRDGRHDGRREPARPGSTSECGRAPVRGERPCPDLRRHRRPREARLPTG